MWLCFRIVEQARIFIVEKEKGEREGRLYLFTVMSLVECWWYNPKIAANLWKVGRWGLFWPVALHWSLSILVWHCVCDLRILFYCGRYQRGGVGSFLRGCDPKAPYPVLFLNLSTSVNTVNTVLAHSTNWFQTEDLFRNRWIPLIDINE